MPKAQSEGRKEPTMVTFAKAAELVVEYGLAPSMTAEGLRKIARTDPNWTVSEEDYEQVANARSMPWALVKRYFELRSEQGFTRGRGPDKQPRRAKPQRKRRAQPADRRSNKEASDNDKPRAQPSQG